MTPQQQLNYLLESVWVPTNKLVTIGTIRDECGFTLEQYGLVRGTLDGAIATLKADADPVKRLQGIELQDALTAMLSGGIPFGETRQATVDLLAVFGQWPDAVRDTVKALGGQYKPRWQVEGRETEPTLAEFEKQAIRTATTGTVQALIDPLQSKLNAIDSWLATDEALAKSVVDYQAYADSLLASEDGNP